MKHELRYVRTDRNGTEYYEDFNCPRCAGEGRSDDWWKSGFVCYQCGGSGKIGKAKIVKKMTAEHLAKLDAKRLAKMPAEVPAEVIEEKMIVKMEDPSKWVGELNEKLELEVTLEAVPSFQTKFGITRIYIFRDAEGNRIVWKTAGWLSDGPDPDYGSKLKIRGTVKEHSVYKEAKQTSLVRVKMV